MNRPIRESDYGPMPFGHGGYAIPLALLIGLTTGCSRAYYRESADAQTYEILAEKSQDPRWLSPILDITPDPRSRFAEFYVLDCPPLPPDDPAAHESMHFVYGMQGSSKWETLGSLASVANPTWRESLRRSAFPPEDGSPPNIEKLGLDEAIQLALIHSRDHQEQLENVYLAALALTFEHYRFDVRGLGFIGEPGSELFYQHQPSGSSDLILGPSNFGLRKLLPGGAQLIAEMTNDTIWMFSGSNGTGTATSFAYRLVQPLLAGAGQKSLWRT